ncbi:MAG: hypothetical protein WC717_02075, partial [Candidatus Micrarchaeia archaeon]
MRMRFVIAALLLAFSLFLPGCTGSEAATPEGNASASQAQYGPPPAPPPPPEGQPAPVPIAEP